jgi:hypothetical protein
VFIAMSMNSEDKNTFASFHIRQGLGITLTFSLGLIISNFDSLLISASMWVSSLYFGRTDLQCNKGETKPMPILGDLFKNGFQISLEY